MDRINRNNLTMVCILLVLAITISLLFPTTKVYADTNAPVSLAQFSGGASQWTDVDHDTQVRSSSLTAMKAVQADGKIYLCVEGAQMDNGSWTAYIDSDNNGSTGCSVNYWKDSGGIDYKLTDSGLYKYNSGSWEAVQNPHTEVSRNSENLEISVDINDLGLEDSAALKVAFGRDGINMLPEASENMMLVNEAENQYGQGIDNLLIDGAGSEWAGVAPLLATADGNTTVKAVICDNKLDVIIEGKISDAGFGSFWEFLYIDADRNAATGNNCWQWPDQMGADFAIQTGCLYRGNGSGGWEQITDTALSYATAGEGANKVIEWSVPLEDVGINSERSVNISFYGDEQNISTHTAKVNPAAPRASTGIEVTADGNPAEWAGMAPVLSTSAGSTSVSAIISGDKLSMLVNGQIAAAEFGGFWEFVYLDVDRNPATGNSSWAFPGLGADYAIQTGCLYRGDGSGGWEQVADTALAYATAGSGADKTIEWTVPISDLGMNSGRSISIAFYGDDNNRSPDMAVINPAAPPAGPDISVDGDRSDWEAIDNTVLASGAVFSLYTVQDEKRLYTLVSGHNLNTVDEYYIDSDNDSTTGYALDGLWTGTGIDYMVSSGKLYRLTGSNPGADRTLIGDVYTYYTENAVEMYLDLNQIGKTGPSDMKIGYMGRGGLDIPSIEASLPVINKTLTREVLRDTFYPGEYYGVLNNPYMGWAPWSPPSESEGLAAGTEYPQSHKLVYAGVTWKEIEPAEGRYAWDAIEEKYQFDFWAQNGSRINLRIVMDTPASESHMDIPQWLYDKIGGEGTFYDNSSVGKGFSPNYNNETLIAEHKKLLEALAGRYKDDPRIGFIQLGSLGHWGEWHCWPYTPSTGVFPSLEVSDQYVQHYIDAFGDSKKLTMRRGYGLAGENRFGLFNDMFGDLASLTSPGWGWLDQIQNGYVDDFGAQQPAMADFWKYGPAGGEFANGNAFLYLTDDTIMSSLNQARLSHTSWLGPCSPAKYQGGALQANMDALLKTMGYRFVIESVTHAAGVQAGSKLPISLTVNNKGVAPFYFDWPVVLSLVDAQGNTAARINTDFDVKSWLPGRTVLNTEITVPGLIPGNYTLCISIDDPDTGNPGIDFANTGRRENGSYTLDHLIVSSSGNSVPSSGSQNGQQPVQQSETGITVTPELENGAARIKVNEAGINAALKAAEADANGVRTIDIAIAQVENAASYQCELPGSIFSQGDPKQILWLKTPMGNIRLPGNMLQSSAWNRDLPVTVEIKSSEEALLPEAGYAMGNRPVIDIRLKQDGKNIAWSNSNVRVTVAIPYKPSGEELKKAEHISIRYIDDSGRAIPVPDGRYDPETGSVIFTTNHFSRYAVSFVDKTFSDLDKYPEERPMIEVLAAKGITGGTGGDRYSPAKSVSRGDFVLMLVKALGLQSEVNTNFSDVAPASYYYEAVGIAKTLGITSGSGGGRFNPGSPVSKQEAAVLAMKALEIKGLVKIGDDTSELSKYKDGTEVVSYAGEEFSALLKEKIFTPEGEALSPGAPLSRAQAAEILYNLYNK